MNKHTIFVKVSAAEKPGASDRSIAFELTVEDKITVLSGRSGSGKSLFAKLISSYNATGNPADIELRCDIEVSSENLNPDPKIGLRHLSYYRNRILVLDSDCLFMYTKEFADYVNSCSDTYFVLITNAELPYINDMPKVTYDFVERGNYKDPHFLYNIAVPFCD